MALLSNEGNHNDDPAGSPTEVRCEREAHRGNTRAALLLHLRSTQLAHAEGTLEAIELASCDVISEAFMFPTLPAYANHNGMQPFPKAQASHNRSRTRSSPGPATLNIGPGGMRRPSTPSRADR